MAVSEDAKYESPPPSNKRSMAASGGTPPWDTGNASCCVSFLTTSPHSHTNVRALHELIAGLANARAASHNLTSLKISSPIARYAPSMEEAGAPQALMCPRHIPASPVSINQQVVAANLPPRVPS
eukprot:1159578-Pelagomonas_calceolata.AAC.3